MPHSDIVPPKKSSTKVEKNPPPKEDMVIINEKTKAAAMKAATTPAPAEPKPAQNIDTVSNAPTMDKRSIRKISLDKNKRRRAVPPPRPLEERSLQSRKSSSKGLWFIAAVAVVFLFFTFSLVFSSTKIVVEPKVAQVTLDGVYEALEDPDSESDALGYDVMTIALEQSREVPAKGEEFKEKRASGGITIFNDFSEETQRLVKNTRFESPGGLIYRIPESVEVPGQKTNDNGDTLPGSIDVTVFADETGEEYNTGLTDFTVPGFKGSPQFDSFYARSKTEMSGGFAGNVKIVDEQTRENTVATLQEELRGNLFEEANLQVPDSFFIFDEGIDIRFESLLDKQVDSGTVALHERGILSSIIIHEGRFARFVAYKTLSTYEGEDIQIENIDAITISRADNEADISDSDGIALSLRGETALKWLFDEDELKEKFVGKSKKDVDSILQEFPSIDKAEVIVRPFWKKSFPDSLDKIKIEVVE